MGAKNSHMKIGKRDEDPLVPGHYYLFNWVKPYLKNSKVLDVGCWTGPMEILLSKVKCTVSGIDIEEEPLIYARKRFPKFMFKKASVSEALPFKKNEFDVVLFFMVIEHIAKGTEVKALENINRVMRKDGTLFINTMHNNPVSNILDPAYFLGHRHYSRPELEAFLKKAGFQVEEVKYNAGFFTSFYIYLLYFFKHVLRKKEPRFKIVDRLMELDYKNHGFIEIDIRARKTKNL